MRNSHLEIGQRIHMGARIQGVIVGILRDVQRDTIFTVAYLDLTGARQTQTVLGLDLAAMNVPEPLPQPEPQPTETIFFDNDPAFKSVDKLAKRMKTKKRRTAKIKNRRKR